VDKDISTSTKSTPTPLVTVVTIAFNEAEEIENTIKSVLTQDYPALEYIIIDGGSTDGTVDIIKQYAEEIDYWVSEPDEGIFYAMNKGVRHANGEWINFMNSGDLFASSNAVSLLMHNSNNADVVYGSSYKYFGKLPLIHMAILPISRIKQGMPFNHQSALVRTKFLREQPFDISSVYSADYEFFYNLWLSGSCFKGFNQPISTTESLKSLTNGNRLKGVLCVMRVSLSKEINLFLCMSFARRILIAMIVDITTFLLPTTNLKMHWKHLLWKRCSNATLPALHATDPGSA